MDTNKDDSDSRKRLETCRNLASSRLKRQRRKLFKKVSLKCEYQKVWVKPNVTPKAVSNWIAADSQFGETFLIGIVWPESSLIIT